MHLFPPNPGAGSKMKRMNILRIQPFTAQRTLTTLCDAGGDANLAEDVTANGARWLATEVAVETDGTRSETL